MVPSGFMSSGHLSSVPLIKTHSRVRYLLDFDLKIRSGQVCGPSYFETALVIEWPLSGFDNIKGLLFII